jgi:hypothetical protein
MGTYGSIGYIKNKKRYLIHVQYDADLLWNVSYRELYVLLCYYKSIEILENLFLNLKVVTDNYSIEDIDEKVDSFLMGTHKNSCSLVNTLPEDLIIKIVTDVIEQEKLNLVSSNINNYSIYSQDSNTWYSYLRCCQGSYINILDSKYFLNDGYYKGYVCIIDFDELKLKSLFVDYQDNVELLNEITFLELIKKEELKNLKSLPEIRINTIENMINNIVDINRFNNKSCVMFNQRLKDLNII